VSISDVFDAVGYAEIELLTGVKVDAGIPVTSDGEFHSTSGDCDCMESCAVEGEVVTAITSSLVIGACVQGV